MTTTQNPEAILEFRLNMKGLSIEDSSGKLDLLCTTKAFFFLTM